MNTVQNIEKKRFRGRIRIFSIKYKRLCEQKFQLFYKTKTVDTISYGVTRMVLKKKMLFLPLSYFFSMVQNYSKVGFTKIQRHIYKSFTFSKIRWLAQYLLAKSVKIYLTNTAFIFLLILLKKYLHLSFIVSK